MGAAAVPPLNKVFKNLRAGIQELIASKSKELSSINIKITDLVCDYNLVYSEKIKEFQPIYFAHQKVELELELIKILDLRVELCIIEYGTKDIKGSNYLNHLKALIYNSNYMREKEILKTNALISEIQNLKANVITEHGEPFWSDYTKYSKDKKANKIIAAYDLLTKDKINQQELEIAFKRFSNKNGEVYLMTSDINDLYEAN